MFPQHGSSSDKEMADEVQERPRDVRERMPLKSRENHPPSGRSSTRHMRERTELNGREPRDRSERNRETRDRPDQEKSLRELSDRQEIKEKNGARGKADSVITNDDKDLRLVVTICIKQFFTVSIYFYIVMYCKLYDFVFRTRKIESPCRTREGPVTRLCGSLIEKDEKVKSEPNDANEESSRESERQGNNDNSDNEDVRNDGKATQV